MAMKSVRQNANHYWAQMANEDGFVNSTIKTMLIALGLCLAALLFCTWNITASLLVIICMAIVMTTIGFIIV